MDVSIAMEAFPGPEFPGPEREPELLAIAGDPVRWRLLAALAAGTRCVCELRPIARVTAPALSHHLRVLRESGLVTARRRGRWIDYTLAPDAGDRLLSALPVSPAGPTPGIGGRVAGECAS